MRRAEHSARNDRKQSQAAGNPDNVSPIEPLLVIARGQRRVVLRTIARLEVRIRCTTGVIEGACCYLVKHRMNRTGRGGLRARSTT